MPLARSVVECWQRFVSRNYLKLLCFLHYPLTVWSHIFTECSQGGKVTRTMFCYVPLTVHCPIPIDYNFSVAIGSLHPTFLGGGEPGTLFQHPTRRVWWLIIWAPFIRTSERPSVRTSVDSLGGPTCRPMPIYFLFDFKNGDCNNYVLALKMALDADRA